MSQPDDRKLPDHTISGERFSLLDEADAKLYGYGPDDADVVLVRREANRKCFELYIDVSAQEIEPLPPVEKQQPEEEAASPPQIPGQEALF